MLRTSAWNGLLSPLQAMTTLWEYSVPGQDSGGPGVDDRRLTVRARHHSSGYAARTEC